MLARVRSSLHMIAQIKWTASIDPSFATKKLGAVVPDGPHSDFDMRSEAFGSKEVQVIFPRSCRLNTPWDQERPHDDTMREISHPPPLAAHRRPAHPSVACRWEHLDWPGFRSEGVIT